MRYSEILNEDGINLYITSFKSLKTMLSHGEVKLPPGGTLQIWIETYYSIQFPPNFIVHGNVQIYGAIKNITGDLKVMRSLDVGRTDAKTLPEKLTVGENLDLIGTYIKTLPNNLNVGGDLHIEGTAIIDLSKGLIIGGDLYIDDDTELKLHYNPYDINERPFQINGKVKNADKFNYDDYNYDYEDEEAE